MKNQKITIIALLIIIVALVAYNFIIMPKNNKLVYVETGILLNEYEGMKQARIKIEDNNKKLGAEVDSLIQMFQSDLKAYEKDRKKMSKKERELKEELLRTRQQQVNNFQQAKQIQAQEEEQKITQTQMNRINDFIKVYGQKKGYTYILGANGSGNVVYAEEAYNITKEVIEGLNKQYKEEYAK